jgi:hypothetical protein
MNVHESRTDHLPGRVYRLSCVALDLADLGNSTVLHGNIGIDPGCPTAVKN